MMAKIIQGTSFKNAIEYVLNRDEAYIMTLKGIKDGTKSEMAHSFETQSKMRPLTKPVAHISLNFSVEDKHNLTDEKMGRIAVEYLKRMGYGSTQFLMVRHTDRAHPHLHIIANRIDFDGKRISDQNERVRNMKICKELTKKHGLFIANGKDNVNRHRLREPERTRYMIYDSLKKNIPLSKSWTELQQKLRTDGIDLRFKTNGSTSKVQGVVFTANNLSFNGSKVDRKYSYSKIDVALDKNRQAMQNSIQQNNSSHLFNTKENSNFGIGDIFNLPDNLAIDPNEEQFRHEMQKKKKKPQRKIRF